MYRSWGRPDALWFVTCIFASLSWGIHEPSIQSNLRARELRGDYTGRFRPQVHFSPPWGFMNDPNGMFKDASGTYHLYYQLNPTGLTIGNQHWGHATSSDLYHWENHGIALAPENDNEAMFSGSAVIDKDNTSGFFADQGDGVVIMYTLNTPEEQSQHIAFSSDGGYSFTKYDANPVISVGSTEFRDPKIVWHAPTARWIVVIAYAREYVVGIWTSPNLREWTHASNFSHAGLLGLQYECPNLVPMPMLKNASLPMDQLLDKKNVIEDANLWLMFLSINPGAPLGGSGSEYIPGTFNGTHFQPVDGAARLSDFAKDNYAGQFFSGIPDIAPQISIQWASNWQYTNDVPTDTEGWRSVMALPRRHVLANTTRTPYALLSIPPPLDHLCSTQEPLVQRHRFRNKSLTLDYGQRVPSGAVQFSITACNLPKNPRGSLNFTIFSSKSEDKLEGGYVLRDDSTFFLDRSRTYGFSSPYFTGQFSAAHPVDSETGCFHVLVVVDRTIIEVFLDNGVRSATAIFFPSAPLDRLVIATGELDSSVDVSVEVRGLKSTWDQGKTGARNASQIVQQEGVYSSWDRNEL